MSGILAEINFQAEIINNLFQWPMSTATGAFGAISLLVLLLAASGPEPGLEPATALLRQVLELPAAALPPMSRTALPSLLVQLVKYF